MNSLLSKPRSRRPLGSTPAAIAIALLSWTFPRVGFLKLSEAFALLAVPRAIVSNRVLGTLVKCYWPFVCASILSFFTAFLMIGQGDNTLTGSKGLYSRPEFMPSVTLIHIGTYLLTIAAITQYFAMSSEKQISNTMRWAYYVTLFPGLLQLFRIYSGIYFSLPWFERDGVGPFSGVFNSGYLRVMGFEFEPLAYASSLIALCCLSMHNRRRIPWLALIVLWHTYSAGAMIGTAIALLVSASKMLTRIIVPLYALVFTFVCWFITNNIQLLTRLLFVSGSITERIGATYACVAMWLDHPLGVGLGLYGYFFNHYDPIGSFPAATLDYYPNNDPVMFLAYGGPVFLAAYLYTFYFVLRRAQSYWLRVAALALLFQSGSSYLFFNPAIIIIFSLLLARARPITKQMNEYELPLGLGRISESARG